jgi:membrane fusion protein, heavy metal efflux system
MTALIKRILFVLTIPLIMLTLLSVPTGCGKDDARKKEARKVESGEKKPEAGEKTEEPDTVVLTPEQVKGAHIATQKIATGSFAVPLAATAVIEPNSDKVSKVGSKVSGRITRVTARQGDRVNAGQPLAYLESVDLDQAWSDYAKAKGRHGLAATNLRREETLFERKVAPEKDVLKARQEFKETEAELKLSVRRLKLLGVEGAKPDGSSDGPNEGRPFVVIPSPIHGVVIEKTVTQGEMVSPDKVLFTVSDLSNLWVVIDIYEKDLRRLKTGMEVKLLVTAYPDVPFRGRVSYIGDMMDEKTRTVKARVTVDNTKGILKPGMFATVSIDAMKGASEEKLLAVPEEAVCMEGPSRYVFVVSGPDRFKKRDVTVGRTLGKVVETTGGLKEGDEVVVKGAFILKSELNKKSLTEE